MHSELYLVKGLPPKRTGAFLGLLAQKGFPRIPHLKRVKSRSSSENLVLVDRLPADSTGPFRDLFQDHSNALVPVPVDPAWLRARLAAAITCKATVAKLALLTEALDEEERVYVLQIRRSGLSLVD